MSRFQGCLQPPYGWVCIREQGHDGPCAAMESGTSPLVIVDDPAQCPYTNTMHDGADHRADVIHHVQCRLAQGHSGQHRGEVAW